MTTHDDRGGGAGPAAVPRWKLERYVLGELPADELAGIHERVGSDADLRRQVEALKASNVEILRAFPAPWVARQIRTRAQGANGHGSAWSWWWAVSRWPVVPVAAAALLALAVVPVLRSGEEGGERSAARIQDGVRVKGTGARLFLHRKTPMGSERLEDGAVARAGDLIRIQYDAVGATYGVILSVDGRGAVTRHLPVRGDTAAALEPGGSVSLESSYELDDAPRWERFFLVTSVEPFPLAPVVSAVAAATAEDVSDSLALGPGLDQTGVTLEKVEAPR